MANTFLIERMLVAQGARSNWIPEILPYTLAAAQTFFNGAVLIVSSGNAQEAANDPVANIIGISLQSALAVYNPAITAPANQEQPYYATLFGASQFATKLEPGDAAQVHVAHAVSGQYYEGTAALGASASTDIGLQFAVEKDATTGYWIIDRTDTTNKAVQVVALVQKPKMLPGTSPAISQGGAMPAFGDTNVRYLFFFMSTVTA